MDVSCVTLLPRGMERDGGVGDGRKGTCVENVWGRKSQEEREGEGSNE